MLRRQDRLLDGSLRGWNQVEFSELLVLLLDVIISGSFGRWSRLDRREWVRSVGQLVDLLLKRL